MILTGKTTINYQPEDIEKVLKKINTAIEGLDEAAHKAIGVKILVEEARELKFVPGVRPTPPQPELLSESEKIYLAELDECAKIMHFLATVNYHYFEMYDEPERTFWTVMWRDFLSFREAKALAYEGFYMETVCPKEEYATYLNGISQLPVHYALPSLAEAKRALNL